jgi:BolA protein
MTTRIARLTDCLQALEPSHLEIIDNSHLHAGHAAMKGIDGEETHLKIHIASPHFEGKTRIARHRMVQELCKPEMGKGLHALEIKIEN